jgi:glutathione S-transferase
MSVGYDITMNTFNSNLNPNTLGSPFVRPVREILGSLALPHRMVYSGRGSSNREVMRQKTDRFQVPYIEDPNTGVKMFESGAIVKYLLETYTYEV